MSITIYVPQDAVALGLGANRVARAIFKGAEARGLDLRIVRTGTRGLLWLEPMVEVATPAGKAMKRVCVDGPVFDATTVFA